MVSGMVTNIQRFSVHDGPGVRTVVFLKGCPLDCCWCHNPETKDSRAQPMLTPLLCTGCGACRQMCPAGCHVLQDGSHCFNAQDCRRCMACVEACTYGALEVCGSMMTVDEALAVVLRDVSFYGSQGGLTISGGEPMAQPDFTLELLRKASESGLTTCVETCGYFPSLFLPELCKWSDWLLWDVKDTDDARHKKNTGRSNRLILENLHKAAQLLPGKIVIRGILVKGIQDNRQHVARLYQLAREINAAGVDLLPFHPFGNSKRTAVGMLSHAEMGKAYIPDADWVERLKGLAYNE